MLLFRLKVNEIYIISLHCVSLLTNQTVWKKCSGLLAFLSQQNCGCTVATDEGPHWSKFMFYMLLRVPSAGYNSHLSPMMGKFCNEIALQTVVE